MPGKPITVIVRLKAKPGKEARVREEVQKLLRPTRAEKGCINCDMHQAAHDASLCLFHENWASEEDLKRHLEAPHIKRWVQLAEGLLAEPLDLTLWEKVNERGS